MIDDGLPYYENVMDFPMATGRMDRMDETQRTRCLFQRHDQCRNKVSNSFVGFFFVLRKITLKSSVNSLQDPECTMHQTKGCGESVLTHFARDQ